VQSWAWAAELDSSNHQRLLTLYGREEAPLDQSTRTSRSCSIC